MPSWHPGFDDAPLNEPLADPGATGDAVPTTPVLRLVRPCADDPPPDAA